MIRFDVTPSLPIVDFSEQSSVKEALDLVLRVKNRTDPDGQLLATLLKSTPTVGDLRLLTDQEWNALELPLICRLYLRILIRSSGRRKETNKLTEEETFLKKLETDLNHGQPLNTQTYSSNLANLIHMGFPRNLALETLVLSKNRIQEALELCIDPVRKGKKRLEFTSPASSSSTSSTPSSAASAISTSSSAELMRQLAAEQQTQQNLEKDIKQLKSRLERTAYVHFLRGLLVIERITPQELEKLKKIQGEMNITDRDHKQALEELGMTLSYFDTLKKTSTGSECVTCLDRIREFVIMPCSHLCLCEVCAEPYNNSQRKCPVCAGKITKLIRVFDG